jgi:hypothetical protein
MKNWFWIGLVLVVAGSCLDEPECLRTSDSTLYVSFTRLSDGKPDTLIVYNISSGADSIFYMTNHDKLDTLEGKATLAVNPFANETFFTFSYEMGTKSLKVGYKTQTRFISEECGSEQVLYDLSILETDFDSVRIVNNRLTTSKTTNVEIFN